ncbi:MAG TPA: hypothetical protein VGF41_03360 [Myxococcaceae bacterium]|jgi:hypothetical protein
MSENKVRTWVQGVAAAFLCATAAVSYAVAGGHSPGSSAGEQQSVRYVPPGMHEADASADIGPGSDEAQAASSPSAE